MTGGQRIGAEIAGRLEEIGKFDVLIAGDARDWRFAGDIALRETVDDFFAEAAFVVQHIMGDAEPFGDPAGIVYILAGAASALAMRRRSMVIELQRDAEDIIAVAA